ncbi:hypothetical protein K0M31_009398 [Melipona bicolor]|uniref:Uncharacterized protein n=1 Tax=Melipona bicolor TaxID=60889 RepID=A0AA40FN52_9HYME|nr:hypothetical protein K0M31_009398 [Melipona bicolor]
MDHFPSFIRVSPEFDDDFASIFSSMDESSYFYLYRISYLWYNPLGLTITLIIGYLISLITNKILYKNAREPEPSLFTPLLASRIRRRRQDADKTTSSQLFVLENRR